jgi:predicted nucleotidyltransferase
MGESRLGIVEQRRLMREEAIRTARGFAERVKACFEKVSVVLIGSYARGDFNEWSDVDVLIVVEKAPSNPLERMDCLLERCPPPTGVEPIILSLSEFMRQKHLATPLYTEACGQVVVLVDDLGLFPPSCA